MMFFKQNSWIKFCILFLLSIFILDSASAQRRRRKGGKNKGEPKVLKDLPRFFVNDASLPKYLKRIYKQDATRLAVRLLNKEVRINKQTVRVPDELVQAVYNALIAVRVSDYSIIETIAGKYYIRTFPAPNVDNLILVAEHDAEWILPLKQRQDTTGSVTVNNIMREYNLHLKKMVYLDEERIGLVLNSVEPLNMPALTMRFFMDEGIGAIEEIMPYGDGNDIEIVRTKKGWDLTYSLRFGNCTHQCQKRHDWTFSVDKEGAVSYGGESGQTIPPWISADRRAKKYPDVLN